MPMALSARHAERGDVALLAQLEGGGLVDEAHEAIRALETLARRLAVAEQVLEAPERAEADVRADAEADRRVAAHANRRVPEAKLGVDGQARGGIRQAVARDLGEPQ